MSCAAARRSALEDPLVIAVARRRITGTSSRPALEVLNATDVVIVQHEYGIYDGTDGESVLGVMAEIVAPIVLIAHTVRERPDAQPAVGARAGLLPWPTSSW